MKVLIVTLFLVSVAKSQRNIASHGTASQSSVYYWKDRDQNMTADLAITGGRTHNFYGLSCATTRYSPTQYVAWWMFTLPVDTVYITTVNMYYRYNRQYVIIYNERNETTDYNPPGYSNEWMLELCEVEVYGWWGTNCSKSCPVYCISGHCTPGNGSCAWGCNSYNCLTDGCDTATGVCSHGCRIGLERDFYDRFCEYGKFGIECTKTCHCNNQTCDPRTGTSPPGGCKRGYTGISCSTECSLGYYGYNCNESCDGCLSDACDREFGINNTNTSGRKHGWQPGHEKCDLACVSGIFGDKCTQTCHCIDKPCDPITGTCPPGGCQRGYTGITCSTECTTGTYGVNCESRRDTCLGNICESRDRNCTYGCIEGFKGVRCNLSEVVSGTFGINCESRCDTCVNKVCDRQDGQCAYGCIDCYEGDRRQLPDTDERKQMYTNWNEKDKNSENFKMIHFRKIRQIFVGLFLTKTKMHVHNNIDGAHYEEATIPEQDQPYDLIGQ